jgi:hypothetical protein
LNQQNGGIYDVVQLETNKVAQPKLLFREFLLPINSSWAYNYIKEQAKPHQSIANLWFAHPKFNELHKSKQKITYHLAGWCWRRRLLLRQRTEAAATRAAPCTSPPSPGQNCRREPLSSSAPIFGCVLLPKPLDLAKKGSAATREEVSEMGGGRS